MEPSAESILLILTVSIRGDGSRKSLTLNQFSSGSEYLLMIYSLLGHCAILVLLDKRDWLIRLDKVLLVGGFSLTILRRGQHAVFRKNFIF